MLHASGVSSHFALNREANLEPRSDIKMLLHVGAQHLADAYGPDLGGGV